MSDSHKTRHLAPVDDKAVAAAEARAGMNEQANRILKRHLAGETIWGIAEAEGLTHSAVAKTLRQVLDETADLIDTGAKQRIVLAELLRLDRMQNVVWPQVEAGDVRAGEYVLKVMSHRMKLLGLDQNVVDNRKQTVVIAGDSDSYLAAIEQAMGGQS